MPAIVTGELKPLLRLLGPPSERQRNLRWATDVVLIENGALIYSSTSGTPPMPWRACKRRSHEHPALKRELALLRSSLAALTPSQPARLDEPIAWAERLASLRQSGFLFRKLFPPSGGLRRRLPAVPMHRLATLTALPSAATARC